MKRLTYRLSIFLLTAWLLGSLSAHAQHLNAGAVGHQQNDALLWVNGDAFATQSGYVQSMPLAVSGRYAGLYNSGPTLTALASTEDGPALGSFIVAEIVSLTGPAGGLFSFWEGVDQGGSSTPTFSIATGGSGLSYRFDLSDAAAGAGQPGQDPLGHLHGRRFTATEPGTYTVGWRALDTSVNGEGGGPIHLPSQILYVNFAAVPEPSIGALIGAGLAGLWWWRRQGRS